MARWPYRWHRAIKGSSYGSRQATFWTRPPTDRRWCFRWRASEGDDSARRRSRSRFRQSLEPSRTSSSRWDPLSPDPSWLSWFSWLLGRWRRALAPRSRFRHAVKRVVGHAPLAVRLATIDAQKVAARFGRVATGLGRGGDGVGTALVRQVTRDEGFHGRPGLVDLDRLKRAAVGGVVRGFADERRPAGRDHDVTLVREAAQRGDVPVVDRLQILPVELSNRGQVLLERWPV